MLFSTKIVCFSRIYKNDTYICYHQLLKCVDVKRYRNFLVIKLRVLIHLILFEIKCTYMKNVYTKYL